MKTPNVLPTCSVPTVEDAGGAATAQEDSEATRAKGDHDRQLDTRTVLTETCSADMYAVSSHSEPVAQHSRAQTHVTVSWWHNHGNTEFHDFENTGVRIARADHVK